MLQYLSDSEMIFSFLSFYIFTRPCHLRSKNLSAPPSSNEEEALDELEAFGEIWDSKYPMIRKSWETHWNDLKEFFSYPEEIRKLIYTTNAIESLNYTLRKVTKNRNAFPDDDSVYKHVSGD